MKQLLMALRAIGILAAIWAVLAGIALAAGVLPPFGPETVTADGPGDGDADGDGDGNGSAVDDGDADGDAAAEALGGGSGDDDSDEDADALADPDATPPPTYAICSADDARITLSALEVVGDSRPEIAIGCGAQVHVYAFGEDDVVPVPIRVAVLDAAPEGGATPPSPLSAGTARSMDVDGDGLADLVVPFHGVSADGDTRGGALFLLRRDSMGSFEAPALLAPIASEAVALAQLDGQPGFEIVATNRGSDLARRPSEIWVFTGGAAPARASVLRSSTGGIAFAIADLDRDGQKDVVVTARATNELKIHFGDGTGHFPRTSEITLGEATEVVAGDMDGDGGEDVVIRAAGLHLVAAGPAESLTPRPIDAPATIHDITVRDLDGDRKRDIIGIDGPRLTWLRQGDDLAFTEETLVSVSGAALVRYVLSDLDGDGKTDLVAIGRAPEPGAPWSLTVVPDVREAESVTFTAAGASAPANAPLTLRVTLR